MNSPEQLAEFYASAPSEGARLFLLNGDTNEWVEGFTGPNLASDLSKWRWKPALKTIDLTPLKNGHFLCLDKKYAVCCSEYSLVDEIASPFWDAWQYWGGGKCPVPKGLTCKVRYRNGNVGEEGHPMHRRWEHTGFDSDIIAVMFVGVQEGYQLP